MGDDSPLGLVAQATAPALRKGREQGQAAQLRHAPTHGAEEDQIGGIAGADYIHCGAGSHDASVPASTRALPWIESLGSKLVRGQTRDGPASAGQPRQPRDSLATASRQPRRRSQPRGQPHRRRRSPSFAARPYTCRARRRGVIFGRILRPQLRARSW